MSYFNLDRKFVERENYDPNELIALEVTGKLLDWSKVLESRAAIIVAPANFGKTTEMQHRAAQMRAHSEAAVFVALRSLADRGSLEKALTETDRQAYKAWKSSPSGKLTLFIDSLDEAAAGRQESIEHLVRDIADEVSWPNEGVNWIISTRPAVLTADVIEKLSGILEQTTSTVHTTSTTPLTGKGASGSSTSNVTSSAERKSPRIFSMAPLDNNQAKTYLQGKYSSIPGDRLLRLAHERGLSGFAKSPGGLDILASTELLSTPPDSLTEVFNRVVGALHGLRGADPRLMAAGSASPELFRQAAQRLASASQVCQLINIEMPPATLEIPEKALSARLIATPMLNEAAIKQLLNSQLFIDVGFHQVKMYPDELLPFLAAQRLAGLVESPDQALRLIQNFTWVAPSGERGVHRQFFPLIGWLATLNPHCRSVILRYDPQALAFFGDLRNSSVPLADATEALTESIRRLVEQGDYPGRGMYSLTSENYWQAGPERLVSVIENLFDEYGEHDEARKVLLNIAATCRLEILRTKVLRQNDNNYAKLLEDDFALRYLLDLGVNEDFVGLAAAVKSSSTTREGLVALLLGKLGWAHFTPFEVAQVIDCQFASGQQGFSISYMFESGDLLEAATETQLYQLCRGMLVRVARLRKQSLLGRPAYARVIDQYVELVVETVVTLLQRVSASTAQRAARLCLVLQRLLSEGRPLSRDDSLRRALDENAPVRRALLTMVANQSHLGDWELLMAVIGHTSACDYSAEDVELVSHPRLTKVYAEHLAQVRAQPKQSRPAAVPRRRDNKPKVNMGAKKSLGKMLPALRDGTATNGLAWVANWLLQTNPHSRYGEINFEEFEREAGKAIADAVRQGLSQVWRNQAPRFDEQQPQTTYHITAAALQGLHLELGQGNELPHLSEPEVRRALRYGTFEINGYPKWFWALVDAYPVVAASELSKIAEEAGNGPVSREHAEELFTSLTQAPESIREALSPLAWDYLLKLGPSRQYVAEHILNAVMASPDKGQQLEFERLALGKMKSAFKSPLPNQLDAELSARRSEAVLWAGHWLLSYPKNFRKAVSNWGPKDALAVREFIMQLAAHFGRDRGGALMKLSKASDEGLSVLEDLYLWTRWAVDPAHDIERPAGIAYSPGDRDEAQHFRDGLIGVIASANSQSAYDALGRIRASTSETVQNYFRRLQFELRERQFARKPLPQSKYDQFEKDFVADVTDSLSFAMAVHSDLQAVKYDIERGEHSLRSFFSAVDFTHVNKKGAAGEKAGLALEADFQRLLASELNHHARGRYSVSVESHTAEAKRRDVLCSRNDWRASIELKMSERWTLEDYLIALERQLVGQYMRHNRATTGFLVLVLQTKGRTWKNPTTGKQIGFDEVLRILAEKAQKLEGIDRSRYLRVIGIDATAPEDFRAAGKAAKKATRTKPAKTAAKPPASARARKRPKSRKTSTPRA